jgi:hypothetical protein
MAKTWRSLPAKTRLRRVDEWPVHLNDKNVSSREDTVLSWHLAPASEVAGSRTYITILKRALSADSKMVRYPLVTSETGARCQDKNMFSREGTPSLSR